MNWRLVSRLAWRDLRSGEIALLAVALMVAVGTVTSISLFVDRLKQALILESAPILAAERAAIADDVTGGTSADFAAGVVVPARGDRPSTGRPMQAN